LEAEKKFRRIKSYQEILALKERLNSSRLQQKEVRTLEVAPTIESRCNQLKLGHPQLYRQRVIRHVDYRSSERGSQV